MRRRRHASEAFNQIVPKGDHRGACDGPIMTPAEFLAYQRRFGWSLATLGRKPGGTAPGSPITRSATRGKNRRPAPIPKHVELALKWLELEERNKARYVAQADAQKRASCAG
jgi:hypothetical protein